MTPEGPNGPARKPFNAKCLARKPKNQNSTGRSRSKPTLLRGSLRIAVSKDGRSFEELFKTISDQDQEFVNSMEVTTKSVGAARKRFLTWYSAIEEKYGIAIEVAKFADGGNAASH